MSKQHSDLGTSFALIVGTMIVLSQECADAIGESETGIPADLGLRAVLVLVDEPEFHFRARLRRLSARVSVGPVHTLCIEVGVTNMISFTQVRALLETLETEFEAMDRILVTGHTLYSTFLARILADYHNDVIQVQALPV